MVLEVDGVGSQREGSGAPLSWLGETSSVSSDLSPLASHSKSLSRFFGVTFEALQLFEKRPIFLRPLFFLLVCLFILAILVIIVFFSLERSSIYFMMGSNVRSSFGSVQGYSFGLPLHHRLTIATLKTHCYMTKIHCNKVYGNEYVKFRRYVWSACHRAFWQLIWGHIATQYCSCKISLWQHF